MALLILDYLEFLLPSGVGVDGQGVDEWKMSRSCVFQWAMVAA
jgi:hypothetical protein